MNNEFVLGVGNDTEFLTAAFPEVEFNLYKVKVKENSFFSAFSCWVDSEEVLAQLWSRISDLIGTEYQTKLETEFSSWNIYLAFFVPNQISNALKYNIENDTFFVRKIVFNRELSHLEKHSIPKCLSDHILGKDINLEARSIQEVTNTPKYSSTTQSLLTSKLPLGKAVHEIELREAWLEQTILEIGEDEI
jgi:hypothetical protein